MDRWTLLVTGLFAGATAGAVFLGGLWWTTRRLAVTSRPALLFLTSFVVRMGALLAIFYLLARPGRWEPPAAGLVGFTLVRIAALRRARTEPDKETR